MRVILVAMAMVVSRAAWAAPSDNFPIVDVDANCRKWAPVQQALGICIREEQMAYDALRFYWPSLSEDSKAELLSKIGSSAGPNRSSAAFYRILAQIADGLLFSQQLKAQSKTTPRFRY